MSANIKKRKFTIEFELVIDASTDMGMALMDVERHSGRPALRKMAADVVLHAFNEQQVFETINAGGSKAIIHPIKAGA